MQFYNLFRIAIVQEGRQEGRQEGLQEATVALILRQLARRFGSFSQPQKAQVQGLSLTQLEVLTDRISLFSMQNIDPYLDYWRNQQRQQQAHNQYLAQQARKNLETIIQYLIQAFPIKRTVPMFKFGRTLYSELRLITVI